MSVQINIVQNIFLLSGKYFNIRICMGEHVYQICLTFLKNSFKAEKVVSSKAKIFCQLGFYWSSLENLLEETRLTIIFFLIHISQYTVTFVSYLLNGWKKLITTSLDSQQPLQYLKKKNKNLFKIETLKLFTCDKGKHKNMIF